MSCTIYYKGKLKDFITPETVLDYVAEQAEKIDCRCQRENGSLALFFNQGQSEPLVFSFKTDRLDGFCKWNGDEPQEFEAILELFLSLKPMFKSLKVDDDEGAWNEYISSRQPLKITLLPLALDTEKQLLHRMLENRSTPFSELEMCVIKFSGLHPFKPDLLRVIVQDFITIMRYQCPADFIPQTVIDCLSGLHFVEGYPDQAALAHFDFEFPDHLLAIWFSCAFTYQNKGVVYQVPETTRRLYSSKIAALCGAKTIFLNCHSGGVVNAKHAQMRKLAAQYYPVRGMGIVMVEDEPERTLEFFFSMMHYLGLTYVGALPPSCAPLQNMLR